MKRLVDSPAEDALTARAHVLVHTLGPTIESEARLQRVRRSLDAPRTANVPPLIWRSALVTAIVGASAIAVAASGSFSRWRGPAQPATVNASPPNATPAKRRTAVDGMHSAEPVAATPSSQPPEVAVAPPTPRLPTASRAREGAPAELSDIARVHEAAKALRSDRDPSRALQLLEGSGRPIAGPLAEEALALRIEAAAMRNDGRKSKLATAYLLRYPNGRYRALADRVLAGKSP